MAGTEDTDKGIVRKDEEEGEVLDDLEAIKQALVGATGRLQTLLEDTRRGEAMLDWDGFVETLGRNWQRLSESMSNAVTSLEESIRALEKLDFSSPAEEPEPVAESEPVIKEVLFISVSGKVVGVPLDDVQGVFRVPLKAVSKVRRMGAVDLPGRSVPLVALEGMLDKEEIPLVTPKRDKRLISVNTTRGEVGLLVDHVLARKDVPLVPGGGTEPLKNVGRSMMEKEAQILDLDAL
jgi:hypothetical protein